MKKRISLLLALTEAAALLTACGSTPPEPTETVTETTVETQEAVTEPTALPPVIGEEESIPLDEAHFPSENFRIYLSQNADWDRDGILSAEERYGMELVLLQNWDCGSVKGIEYFPELKVLTCFGNGLTELDVTHNPELEVLNCFDNHLTELDVTQNTELDWLNFYGNDISEIDLSRNEYLTGLYCQDNNLSELDVSANYMLKELGCEDNPISELNLLHNIYLELNNVSAGDIPITGK